MWNQDAILYILMGVIIIACLRMYSQSDHYNLKCIISDVDGERYCVRDRSKLQLAADLLANVTNNCKKLFEVTSINIKKVNKDK